MHFYDDSASHCVQCEAENKKRYYCNNKEVILRKNRNYYDKNVNTILAKYKIYYKANKEDIISKNAFYIKRREKIDLNFKLTRLLRSRLNVAIISNYKAGSAISDLGCSIEELKKHLESRFYPNSKTGEVMSWDNYGLFGWHIDHIRPLASFDLSKREELLIACNYTNLQPLWSEDNLCKGDRLTE